MSEYDPNDRKPVRFDGNAYSRALQYPLAVVPRTRRTKTKKDDPKARFAHLVFHRGRVVGSNCGMDLRIGYLPSGPAREKIGPPIAVTQSTANELRMRLNHASQLALLRNEEFTVSHVGMDVTIYVGEQPPVSVKLQPADIGTIPSEWFPPGVENGPNLPMLDADVLRKAVAKTAAWGRGKLKTTIRGLVAGPRKMVAVDVLDESLKLVGTSYELGDGERAAQLPPQQADLMDKNPGVIGWSVLALRWDDMPVDPKAKQEDEGDESDDCGSTITLGDAVTLEDFGKCGCGAKPGGPCVNNEGVPYKGEIHAQRVEEGGDEGGGGGEEEKPAPEAGRRGGGRKKAAAGN